MSLAWCLDGEWLHGCVTLTIMWDLNESVTPRDKIMCFGPIIVYFVQFGKEIWVCHRQGRIQDLSKEWTLNLHKERQPNISWKPHETKFLVRVGEPAPQGHPLRSATILREGLVKNILTVFYCFIWYFSWRTVVRVSFTHVMVPPPSLVSYVLHGQAIRFLDWCRSFRRYVIAGPSELHLTSPGTQTPLYDHLPKEYYSDMCSDWPLQRTQWYLPEEL